MDNLKFLVVDDDPIALEVARERLERLGFFVETRNQALGTASWILTYRPHFVLLDINMPALSGSQLAALIRRRELDTAIIFYSSKPANELHLLAREAGAVGAISKTANEDLFSYEVQRFVRTVLRRQSPTLREEK